MQTTRLNGVTINLTATHDGKPSMTIRLGTLEAAEKLLADTAAEITGPRSERYARVDLFFADGRKLELELGLTGKTSAFNLGAAILAAHPELLTCAPGQDPGPLPDLGAATPDARQLALF